MAKHLRRSIIDPISQYFRSFDERWLGSDRGLLVSWECGRRMSEEDPDRAKRARAGELVQLPWKGSPWRIKRPERVSPKRKFYGSLHYLAMWQGLRGEDLDIVLDERRTIRCSKTGLSVTFGADVPNVEINEDDDQERLLTTGTADEI